MCTLTWSVVREGGYDLFFNRDELNTRGAELPPRVEARDGIEFAAPRDGDRGGSWLLVNAHGVTVALLNDYGARWRLSSGDTISRGALVLACATAATMAVAVDLIRRMPLERTGAFKVVVLGADGRHRRLRWAGEALVEETEDGLAFETSSSFDTEAVCAARRREFEMLLAGREQAERDELAAFHGRHDTANGAASVLMRRADARTRSVTRVSVRAARVEMYYEAVGLTGMTVGFSRL